MNVEPITYTVWNTSVGLYVEGTANPLTPAVDRWFECSLDGTPMPVDGAYEDYRAKVRALDLQAMGFHL